MAAEPKQRELWSARPPRAVCWRGRDFRSRRQRGSPGKRIRWCCSPAEEARRNGEERLQLRERGRYEYRLRPAPGVPDDLQLLRQRGVQPSRSSPEDEDRGLIEPQDHCGLLPVDRHPPRRCHAAPAGAGQRGGALAQDRLSRALPRHAVVYCGEVRRSAPGLPRTDKTAPRHALAAGLAHSGTAA